MHIKDFARFPIWSASNVRMALLCLLVLSACSVGPDYEPPEIPLPDQWQAALKQPALPDRLTLVEYWKLFNDEVLTRLIETGLNENLTITEAGYRIEEALALYGVSRSQYFPDLDFDSAIQRRRRSEAVASAISSPRNDFLSVGGALNWELDILGRIRRLNESASAELDASAEAYSGAIVTLTAEIATAYIRFRTLQAQIELTEKNIKTQKGSLDLAQERSTAGVVPELDVQQAESNLGETQAALPLLRIALARQIHLLAVLTGGFPESVAETLRIPGAVPVIPAFTTNSLPVDVIRQRPDLRQAERELAAQHALIGVAEAELYPIVSLPGFFSFEALNTLESAFRSSSLAYSIGPRIQMNLLDFGEVRNRIAAQEARTLQFESRYRHRVLEAVQEVEDALVSRKEETLRASYLKRSVVASRNSAELVRSLYVSGLTDFQNVLDSERRLFEQEVQHAQSLGNSVEACVALFRALGGGWQQRANETAPSALTATKEATAHAPADTTVTEIQKKEMPVH